MRLSNSHQAAVKAMRVDLFHICVISISVVLVLLLMTILAAVVHEGQVRVPRPDDHFAAGDYIVALIEDSAVDATLDMFSVTGR